MFPEEAEIRRALAARRASRVDWPAIRHRLEDAPGPRRRALGWALVLVVFLGAAEAFRRARPGPAPPAPAGFLVLRAEPNAVVVRPDAETLLVVTP